MENVCSLLPQSVSEECDDYVEAYGDQIIELLAQEIDPAKVRIISPWSSVTHFTAKTRRKNLLRGHVIVLTNVCAINR